MFKNLHFRAGTQVVEHLPIKPEALSSNPSEEEEKEEEQQQQQESSHNKFDEKSLESEPRLVR
jgi:hypothetical protein